MSKILVLNGANLNLLGSREPELYGSDTLADIDARLQKQAKEMGFSLRSYQSNAEHELINQIHAARAESVDYIIINPGAFTHTSIAIRDALLGVSIPFIEVHLSNVHSREDFRKKSYLSDVAVGCIIGLGAKGYELALEAAISKLQQN